MRVVCAILFEESGVDIAHLLLKYPEVRDVYNELNTICDKERAFNSVSSKFEDFKSSLSPEELEVLKEWMR